jgi:hypoxanthine phosphoribosyltransferase
MKTLLSKEELHDGVTRMADKIAACYQDRQLTIVGVLTGSVVLMADLIRVLDLPMRVGVLQASSYRGATTTRGELVINSELMLDISGRDVLLVDDIFDTGHTLAQVVDKMREFEPTSIRSAVLLRKHGRQEVEYLPDFVAFDIPDEFVVGYGLDYEDMYRNLPYLAALEPDDIAKHTALTAGEI